MKTLLCKKNLSRRRGRTRFLKLVHTFACLTVSKTSSRLHLHWIGWRSCFHVLPCEPLQICSQGYMITCLHVLEDPNKSTLLIYSANPLTLYFVNILKGVTETIYIDRNEHSIKAPKSDDGITKLKMLTLCKYMSMPSIPIQYQTRDTKSSRSSLSLVKLCCLRRHEWDQAWMHGKEGGGLVADCAHILLVHKQQLGAQAQTASAWSAPSATCAIVAPANMASGWISS